MGMRRQCGKWKTPNRKQRAAFYGLLWAPGRFFCQGLGFFDTLLWQNRKFVPF
jgi:hypothetical protein